jgi:hypothetical protein
MIEDGICDPRSSIFYLDRQNVAQLAAILAASHRAVRNKRASP